MTWTERDDDLLRQCVFECAYDFDAAASMLTMRLPKQRKLALGDISPQVCEVEYQRLCEQDECAEDEDYDQHDEDGLGECITERCSTKKHVDETLNVPVLELSLSEGDVDCLLLDIPLVATAADDSSEMQWVLAYLEDPANTVDESDAIAFDSSVYSAKGDDCLAQLDHAFQARAAHRCNYDDNAFAPLPTIEKDNTQVTRAPTPVTSLTPDSKPTGEVDSVADDFPGQVNVQPPPVPLCPSSHLGLTAKSPDSEDDSSSDDEWESTRRQLKERTCHAAGATLAQECSDSNDTDDNVDDDIPLDPSEAQERELMKQWKAEVERQERELEFIFPASETTPVIHLESTLEQCQALSFGAPNPFALDENEAPPFVATPLPVPLVKAKTPKTPLATTAAAANADKFVKQEAISKPILPKQRQEPDHNMENERRLLIEQSILKANHLHEPLYHRELSFTPFVPTLPAPYWHALFCYGKSSEDCETLSMENVHVVAMTTDSTSDEFGLLVELFCQLYTQNASCTLLGLQYTVALPPLSTPSLRPTRQSHDEACRVLYIALQCDAAHLDAIFRSPMSSFVPGHSKCVGDYLTRVVLPQNEAIHLFTRLPAFDIFHQTLLCPRVALGTSAPETSVVILATPHAHLRQIFDRTRHDLDLVGLKLCFNASFEPHVVVTREVSTAGCHLALAFRGACATTRLRESLHEVPKTAVYIPHGPLQAKRDVVYWFGGRIYDGVTTQVHVPRPHPVYGIVLKREEIVSVNVHAAVPQLGSVLAAVAATGYDLLRMSRSPRGLNLKLTKEDGGNELYIQALRAQLALATPNDSASSTEIVIQRMDGLDALDDNESLLSPVETLPCASSFVVDFEREQTILAAVFLDASTSGSLSPMLDCLLEGCKETQLIALKLVRGSALELLRSKRGVSFGSSAELTSSHALVVVFRQLIDDGNVKKHFAGLPQMAAVVYVDPFVVSSLLQTLFQPCELVATPPSPLDLCFPPPHGLFQLAPSTPLLSCLVLKPTASDTPMTSSILPVVLRRLERDNFGVVSMVMTTAPPPAFDTSIAGSSPSIVLSLRSLNCISRLQKLVGPDDPAIARQCARFSLIAGYGVDQTHNGFYTSRSYTQASKDVMALIPSFDKCYSDLCRQESSHNLCSKLVSSTHGIIATPTIAVNPRRVFVQTPRTLVETTIAVVADTPVGATLIERVVADGGFKLANIYQGQLTFDQMLYVSSHGLTTRSDGIYLVLALERDNAVSRLLTWIVGSKLFPPTSEGGSPWCCSNSAKDAMHEVPLFFHELHDSVHSIETITTS
ncbi:unnamed protein product [Aphanomyces euteiches]